MPDPTANLTPAQNRLYDTVINDWSGRDLALVLAEQDAPDTDKAAVAQALSGDDI
ncbi:hypothetical protein AB0B94_31000 [Micromonospora sp. NPDC048986]|uniref:hypothetical protein n=1 Tax=Micromonospora sp. NPDC048986 TaxID=3155644 RepID=UPI0033C28FF3